MPVTDAKSWKRGGGAVELELPSGNVCLAQPLGIQYFVRKGTIPNTLLPIIMKAVEEGEGMPSQQMKQIATDTQLLQESLDFMDGVVIATVIKPEIHPTPDGERDPELLYVDELDLDDKSFVVNWAFGGVSDLEQFRKEQAAVVGNLLAGQAVEHSPKPAVGD